MEEEKELSYEDRTDIFTKFTKNEVDKILEQLSMYGVICHEQL